MKHKQKFVVAGISIALPVMNFVLVELALAVVTLWYPAIPNIRYLSFFLMVIFPWVLMWGALKMISCIDGTYRSKLTILLLQPLALIVVWLLLLKMIDVLVDSKSVIGAAFVFTAHGIYYLCVSLLWCIRTVLEHWRKIKDTRGNK